MQRILIAESFRSIVTPLEAALKAAGYDVRLPASQRDIIQDIGGAPVAAVVINLDSHRWGGIDTVRQIRRLDLAQSVKVLAITHHAERSYLLNAARSGVNAVLLRDQCTPQSIVDRVRQLLTQPENPPPAEPSDASADSPNDDFGKWVKP
jgi:DNA-binding NarL/FixJ family response regulator